MHSNVLHKIYIGSRADALFRAIDLLNTFSTKSKALTFSALGVDGCLHVICHPRHEKLIKHFDLFDWKHIPLMKVHNTHKIRPRKCFGSSCIMKKINCNHFTHHFNLYIFPHKNVKKKSLKISYKKSIFCGEYPYRCSVCDLHEDEINHSGHFTNGRRIKEQWNMVLRDIKRQLCR